MARFALIASLVALCGSAGFSPVLASVPTACGIGESASRIEADVRFLGDDLLEGREAGTRGYDLAALYVVAQYRLIGLEPAGDDGTYLQRVPLIRGVREKQGAAFNITRVFLDDPDGEAKRPWARGAANWRNPAMRRLDPDGQPVDDFPALQVRVSAGVHVAEVIFAGSAHTAEEVFARLEQDELTAFELVGEATLATGARLDRLESHNVIGRCPGGNATLAGEHVVYTAHLDHLGIGAEIDGDSIYNGVMDNAVGVAAMLETARLAVAGEVQPARSMLFIALTAEEKGLLGAYHFTAHPTVPRESLVANVNIDMPLLIGNVGDIVPIGIEHSTLGAVAVRAVEEALQSAYL